MSALAPVTEFVTGILPGAAVIGIAYIAAVFVIRARIPILKKRRIYTEGAFFAALTLFLLWIWIYVTHLTPH